MKTMWSLTQPQRTLLGKVMVAKVFQLMAKGVGEAEQQAIVRYALKLQ